MYLSSCIDKTFQKFQTSTPSFSTSPFLKVSCNSQLRSQTETNGCYTICPPTPFWIDHVSFINVVFCEYLTDSSAEKAELLDALTFRSLWRMQTHDDYFPFQITRPSLTSTTTFPSIFPASWTSLICFPSIPDVGLTSESDNFTGWECWDASAASSCINGWGPFHIFSAHLCSRSASVSRFGDFKITSA